MPKFLSVSALLLFLAVGSFAQRTRYVTVISENANLRGTPSASGEILTRVEQGEIFRLVETRGAWFLVETPEYVGWLHGNTIRLGTNAAGSTLESRQNRAVGPRRSIASPRRVEEPPAPRVETSRPSSGAVMASGSFSTGLGYLTISNGTSNDAIAKLIDVGAGVSYREVYVQANTSATISNIAVGDYKLLFSLGQDYAPSLMKFLRNASYSKFDSTITFEETKQTIGNTIRTNYDSYSLTLNQVVGGNAATSRISESEFTKY
jgi:hypothetical protein